MMWLSAPRVIAAPTSTRPNTVTFAPTVVDAYAMIVPTKVDLAPNVAELPTCQKTLQAWAPFVRTIWLSAPVFRADPTWMRKTAPGSFWPSNVRIALALRLMTVAWYIPEKRVNPIGSAVRTAAIVRLRASA